MANYNLAKITGYPFWPKMWYCFLLFQIDIGAFWCGKEGKILYMVIIHYSKEPKILM
jgi:hypothetical protein